MYHYQETHQYVAQIADGLEELGVQELTELGASNCYPVFRGIHFEADHAVLYRINYMSRLITRVLAPLIRFRCRNAEDLYKAGKSVNWNEFFGLDNTFAVFASLSNSAIRHSQFAALRLKDAIADYFRDIYGKRPNVNKLEPDVWVNLHIANDRAVISFDVSGGSLHRRGYRTESVEAPMQETVAAAIIRFTAWNGEKTLYDPFCGSGTLICEALMHYCRIPSGILRNNFGFKWMPDFDSNLWKSIKQDADKNLCSLPKGLIAGSDSSPTAIAAAQTNIRHLPHGQHIVLKKIDFRRIPQLTDSVIVCNPPYGIRMKASNSEHTAIENMYKEFGDFLKKRCTGSTAYIYFGDREFIKRIGLKPVWKKPLKNGGLDGRLVRYDLY